MGTISPMATLTKEPKDMTAEEQVRAALDEFHQVDEAYKSAIAAVRGYAYKYPGITKTIEFALLTAKRDELGIDRNRKLARWASLKPLTDAVRPPPGMKTICSRCGSDLMAVVTGGLRCNACGFQP
jgi:hypothetical protein